jgi:hypothetical protein
MQNSNYPVINKDLCTLVGLEKLYPYCLVSDLRLNEKPIAGVFIKSEGIIHLKAELSPKGLLAAYLHEVGHAIAAKSGLEYTPDADAHNEYFAVLVAVMYRRVKVLDMLKIYDFCDTEKGQSFYVDAGILPSDETLIRRFEYIIQTSSKLASKPLTIEQIAKKLWEEEVLDLWNTATPKKVKRISINWEDLALGAFLSLWGSAAVAGTVWISMNWR